MDSSSEDQESRAGREGSTVYRHQAADLRRKFAETEGIVSIADLARTAGDWFYLAIVT
jgi:hypothetical protein